MYRLIPHEPSFCRRPSPMTGTRGIAGILIGTALLSIPVVPYAAQGLAAIDPAQVHVTGIPMRLSLREAFVAAWDRQPEARSGVAREDAVRARRDVAGSWTAEPMAIEIATKSDRINRNEGSREHEIGLSVPLWLPGERSSTRALADAEATGIATRIAAARLRTSALVREAYWTWERARIDAALARDRLSNANSLAADVARRHRAGDLARSDQYQADGNAAAAQSAVAEADNALFAATQALRALVGNSLPTMASSVERPSDVALQAEPMPALPNDFGSLNAAHPAVADLIAQAEVARRAIDLARTQTRGNPELRLATAQERETYGDSYAHSLTFGVRIPLGSDARYRAKVAQASADQIEIESHLHLERQRVLASLEVAKHRVDATRLQLEAARKRARLALETRGFIDKSFRRGETDLPTRLRIEFEAAEAERQVARAAVDHAGSISALRQALGLLPE